MTGTLSYKEIIDQKKVTEQAIAKLLEELQEQTGALVTGLTTTKLIGAKETKIIISININ